MKAAIIIVNSARDLAEIRGSMAGRRVKGNEQLSASTLLSRNPGFA
jgi:hypothetical protein